MWDLSPPTRDWTCTPCVGRWSPSHWTTREVPVIFVVLVVVWEVECPLMNSSKRSRFGQREEVSLHATAPGPLLSPRWLDNRAELSPVKHGVALHPQWPAIACWPPQRGVEPCARQPPHPPWPFRRGSAVNHQQLTPQRLEPSLTRREVVSHVQSSKFREHVRLSRF